MVFRDMLGTDIGYLESILGTEPGKISSDDVVRILELLCVIPEGVKIKSLTHRAIQSVFQCVLEHILCNYIPVDVWLRKCYSIQNGSFQGVDDMEKVPMSKFTAMYNIHKEAMDQISPNENDFKNQI